MKYSIGYQLPSESDSILSIAQDFKEISEVYFAWPGDASGRSPVGIYNLDEIDDIIEYMKYEIKELDKIGKKLILLFNANCYGANSISKEFKSSILSRTYTLKKLFPISSITTTSPFVAECVKHEYPKIKIRASINMRIDSIKSMKYLSNFFDGYYMRREYNRDISKINELKSWCDNNDKTLHLLANSGCLNHCSFQTYHDNLVAHEQEIVRKPNEERNHPSPCWNIMSNQDNWVYYLQNSWIRPEDIHNYNKYFTTVKLATRMHSNPRKVISAYAREKFAGNLLDLTEPNYGKMFNNHIIDNLKFPSDWFNSITSCNKECEKCNYCESVLSKVLCKVY